MTPDNCPNCGADIPARAKVCPECGADEKTGWSEAAATQGLDLPDQEFDYDEFVKNEFGEPEKLKPRGIAGIWWIVAAVLTVGMIALLFLRG